MINMRSAKIDTRVAHPARVYDYWLGGKDNYAADREAAEQSIAANPDIIPAVRANRAFLGRSVDYLAAQVGIRQFLDIGTGIPTANNTHEVAQRIAADSRVVYVDNDPIVLSHARATITSSPEGATAYLQADLRDWQEIVERAAETLDFDRPVGLMLVAVLQFISDAEDPYRIVAGLRDIMAPGSHLVISHPARDIGAERVAESMRRYNERSPHRATPRGYAEVSRFFDGLELVDPRIVQPPDWRPEPENSHPGPVPMWCGVARKGLA